MDDKTIKLEMMNNINMTQQVETSQPQQQQQPSVGQDERLPEKVLEMYNMLLGITTELEKIKYQMAKRKSEEGEGEEETEVFILCHFRKQKLCCS